MNIACGPSKSDWHRLRKYRRKKERDVNRWAHLYWRYHFRVYGPHKPLWT